MVPIYHIWVDIYKSKYQVSIILVNDEIIIFSKLLYCIWGFPVGAVAKNPPANAGDSRDMGLILGSGRSPQEEMETHSVILAWRIPWVEEPDRLQPTGLQRVGHDRATEHTWMMYVYVHAKFWNKDSMLFRHFSS